MKYKPVATLFEDFFSEVEYIFPVINSTSDGTITSIEIRTTLFVVAGDNVKVDSVDYEVDSVGLGIINIVADLPNPLILEMDRPAYFHGTPVHTNKHFASLNNKQKFPMVYLYEIIKEKKILIPEDSIIYANADIHLFLLDNSDSDDTTSVQYSDVIARMREFWEHIEIEIMKSNRFAGNNIADITLINHVNFGEFLSNRGHKQSIFDEKCSGVEVSFQLPVKKCLICCD